MFIAPVPCLKNGGLGAVVDNFRRGRQENGGIFRLFCACPVESPCFFATF
jgi:hypothetical protein